MLKKKKKNIDQSSDDSSEVDETEYGYVQPSSSGLLTLQN